MKDLKERTIRRGLARIYAQGMEFLLRLVGLMALARLLYYGGKAVIYSAETGVGRWRFARDLWRFDMARYGTEVTLH
jgi:hypothetical protein